MAEKHVHLIYVPSPARGVSDTGVARLSANAGELWMLAVVRLSANTGELWMLAVVRLSANASKLSLTARTDWHTLAVPLIC